MGEEVLEEWGVGEFLVQKCEIGIGGIHYHVFSDTLNGRQIADRLEKYIDFFIFFSFKLLTIAKTNLVYF